MMISLIVPVKNEENSVKKLLDTISEQTRLPEEVIFVDAGSTDKTKEMITLHRNNRLNLKVLSIGASYPGAARNAGVKSASYDNIAFTDGGIELDKDWLKDLSSVMEENPSYDVVYGNYMPVTDTFFKKCLSLAIVPPPRPVGTGKMRPRFIASSLLKKHVWQSVGGFPNLRAAEDRIFMEMVEKKGFKIGHSPDATAVWHIPEDIKGTYKRFCSYSYHDLIAGRWHDWHLPVLKMHMAGFLFLCLGLFISPYFLFFPLLAFIARAAHKININRGEPYLKSINLPLYLIFTGFLIFLIDMAMFTGWIKYILRGKR